MKKITITLGIFIVAGLFAFGAHAQEGSYSASFLASLQEQLAALTKQVEMLIKQKTTESESVSNNVSQREVVSSDNTIKSTPTNALLNRLKVEKIGKGLVRGPGINCGSKCTALYHDGTVVDLQAIPDKLWYFKEWQGCDNASSTFPSCSVVVDQNKTVKAIFTTSTNVGKLNISKYTGSNYIKPQGQVVNIGTNDKTYFMFRMTSQYEAQKINKIKITASGRLKITTLKNIRLYENNNATPIATAAQLDECVKDGCSVTFIAADNILSAPVPFGGTIIKVKADIAGAGEAVLGDNFVMKIATTSDIGAKGSITAQVPQITGTPKEYGLSYIVPQNVVISGIAPLSPTIVGLAPGQTVGIFKVMNNGNAPIYLSTSTMRFWNSGNYSSSTHSLNFKIYASAIGGAENDISGWNGGSGYSALYGSNLGYITYNLSSDMIERKIDAGSWRYITIKTNNFLYDGDITNLSVYWLGNIIYDISESDLGYSGNGDNDLSDLISGIYVDGLPDLATVTHRN